jgi:hypothetical protein
MVFVDGVHTEPDVTLSGMGPCHGTWHTALSHLAQKVHVVAVKLEISTQMPINSAIEWFAGRYALTII